MQAKIAPLLFAVQCAVVGLALAFVIRLWFPSTAVTPNPQRGYADAVERASPSVVSISARRLVRETPVIAPDSTIQQFLGVTPGQRVVTQRTLGSGVIIRDDGYLLTNYHVIAGFTDIEAQLSSGRIVRAVIIGSDPDTDLAVLKIDETGLPAIAIGAVDQMRVGDTVLAIGNPLGIGQSVTMGIVSATGRKRLNISTYENFIQTDAAINQGNSGGALIDDRGALIGINTAVLSRRVEAEGISFAIPIDIARDVLDQVIAHGQVIRGWLGVELVAGVARSANGTPLAQIAISNVYVNGPAARAGLQPGDLLLQFDGEEILSVDQYTALEASRPPGATIPIQASRAGLPFVVRAVLIQRPKPIM